MCLVFLVFHVTVFVYFGTFPDFRNSKKPLQLDHFVRINSQREKVFFLWCTFFESQNDSFGITEIREAFWEFPVVQSVPLKELQSKMLLKLWYYSVINFIYLKTYKL